MSKTAREAAKAVALDPVPVVVVMGASGSGKTPLGQALAAKDDYCFFDAGDFHPPRNVAKTRGGLSLDDVDRAPWLKRLAGLLAAVDALAALACSAQKARYREALASRCPQTLFVHLAGLGELIRARLSARADPYMRFWRAG